MRKPKLSPTLHCFVPCVSAWLWLSKSLLLMPVPTLQASCAVGEGGTLGVDNLGPVHIGDTITVTTVELANLLSSFQATNFNTFVVFPNNNPVQVMHVNAVPPGTSCEAGGATFDEICPGGSDCVSFVNTYVVNFADVGRNLTFSRTVGRFTAVCNASGVPGNIQFEEAGAGAALTGTGGIGTPVGAASLCQTILIPVIFPCISITKECDTNCTPYGQPVFFHGTVSNTGDSPLVKVAVTDTSPTGSTSSAITFDTVQPGNRAWDGTLAAGESAVYHGSYTPPNNGGTSLCGPFTDTISATAVDETGRPLDNRTPCIDPTTGVSTGTRPPVTATCSVSTSPALTLGKGCFKFSGPGAPPVGGSVVVAGDSYVEVFHVSNTGNVPLTGVTITDVSAKTGTTTLTVGNLALGQTIFLTNGPITTTDGDCPGISDSATASGNNLCPADTTCPSAAAVSAGPATCSLTVLCPPRICVTKAITCAPKTGVSGCDGTLAYGPTATGVSGTNNPAFCYQIVVSNCGSDDLTNVTVTDNLIPGVAGSFPSALQVGQSVTNYFGQSYGVGTFTNTVTATGTGVASGIIANAQASAVAKVVPVSVTCSLHLSSPSATTNVPGCELTLPANTVNALVQASLTLNNTGQGDLDVRLIGGSVLTNLVDCSTKASIPAPVVFVPAGQSVTTNVGCVLMSCPGGTVSAVVQGTAIASTSIPCVYDTFGNTITTAPSSCMECVNCQSSCPECVQSVLGLGPAAGCTVLELDGASVSITGPAGGLLGNICIGPNGKLSMSGSEFIAGNVELSPGATFNNSSSGIVGGVEHNVDLSAEIAAANAAANNDAALPCTQTFNTLDGKSVTEIVGGHGLNVICVQDIVLSGKQVLLTGPSDASFIFNVTGKFVLTGGGAGPQIRVDTTAGILPSAVLYNIIGTGPAVAFSGGGGGVNCCAAIVDGTLLAPYRQINLSPGLVNGEVISGMNISIVSGSSVRCPPCP